MNCEPYTRCRTKLDYVSLIKLNLLLGFCAGILSVPFMFLLYSGIGTLSTVNILIGAPICGVIAGLLITVLGYPLYSWITSKTSGHVYSGTFQIDAKQKEL